ncbi:hypothetical protein PROFUN_15512 [Planoprotostelium fungivorum]|uniref:Uncharacterized protein n=1 Tax=Planoprotostelium fungivorum TaxID=1890364 RepID=A0A2P6N385_9EUKA|nr:hypothetical protein PROFUN_15512 [Planoprotostelium fungivorum]
MGTTNMMRFMPIATTSLKARPNLISTQARPSCIVPTNHSREVETKLDRLTEQLSAARKLHLEVDPANAAMEERIRQNYRKLLTLRVALLASERSEPKQL